MYIKMSFKEKIEFVVSVLFLFSYYCLYFVTLFRIPGQKFFRFLFCVDFDNNLWFGLFEFELGGYYSRPFLDTELS